MRSMAYNNYYFLARWIKEFKEKDLDFKFSLNGLNKVWNYRIFFFSVDVIYEEINLSYINMRIWNG